VKMFSITRVMSSIALRTYSQPLGNSASVHVRNILTFVSSARVEVCGDYVSQLLHAEPNFLYSQSLSLTTVRSTYILTLLFSATPILP